MHFTFIDSLKALVLGIKGNPVRRNGHLRLYRQPDHGQVRCISPSEIPEDWMCKKDLCTSRRVENERLRTVFVLTSDKDVKSLPFINYMKELYGHEINISTIKVPTHCPQPRGRETLKWGLRRIEDAITLIQADDTRMKEIRSYNRVFIHSSESGITQHWTFLNTFLSQLVTRSSIWRLIRKLLPFIVNFDFPFISVYDAGAGKYVHLAVGQGPGAQEELWRYSGQDGEEPTYGSAVHHVFPDLDSKNWHRFVSRDRSDKFRKTSANWDVFISSIVTQKLKQAFHNAYIGIIVHLCAERRDSYPSYNTAVQQYEDVDAHRSTEAFGFSQCRRSVHIPGYLRGIP
ncbi:hypothetical protein ASPSYDRAFT_95793 [Aspergillus sydowii CBS 593.65]|uniref:Uncharacterized protein n=1 Tax=Aspergillus sydowii CBS 593.65 TaxID=1036612 RepID=A0A1L9SYQ9_9EURO|nr:uncharacterized protein ASPSYDRAFT_95793 [Aspergillus sydowii CBS 593.65]OJJ52277.1 hypothetical protein ASPSYDRAFT_95793 [Aspergillus sydowii CBS 593.65]